MDKVGCRLTLLMETRHGSIASHGIKEREEGNTVLCSELSLMVNEHRYAWCRDDLSSGTSTTIGRAGKYDLCLRKGFAQVGYSLGHLLHIPLTLLLGGTSRYGIDTILQKDNVVRTLRGEIAERSFRYVWYADSRGAAHTEVVDDNATIRFQCHSEHHSTAAMDDIVDIVHTSTCLDHLDLR